MRLVEHLETVYHRFSDFSSNFLFHMCFSKVSKRETMVSDCNQKSDIVIETRHFSKPNISHSVNCIFLLMHLKNLFAKTDFLVVFTVFLLFLQINSSF